MTATITLCANLFKRQQLTVITILKVTVNVHGLLLFNSSLVASLSFHFVIFVLKVVHRLKITHSKRNPLLALKMFIEESDGLLID